MNLFHMNFFRSEPAPELPPPSLADEAVSLVGFHDAMRANALSELQTMRDRLKLNIEYETSALAEVEAAIAREEAAAPKVVKLEAAE